MILKLKDYKFLKEFHEDKIRKLENRLITHRELLEDAKKNIEQLTVEDEK